MLRRRYLLAMWEGGGNVPPELGVARRLVARGHAVHVLGDPTIEHGATEAGCTFSPWARAPHHTRLDPMEDPIKDWETTNPLVLLRGSGTGSSPARRDASPPTPPTPSPRCSPTPCWPTPSCSAR
jgi:hypothetical protein